MLCLGVGLFSSTGLGTQKAPATWKPMYFSFRNFPWITGINYFLWIFKNPSSWSSLSWILGCLVSSCTPSTLSLFAVFVILFYFLKEFFNFIICPIDQVFHFCFNILNFQLYLLFSKCSFFMASSWHKIAIFTQSLWRKQWFFFLSFRLPV